MNKHKQMLIFKTIVEAGSITKAAEKLELSKSVLSTHLKRLCCLIRLEDMAAQDCLVIKQYTEFQAYQVL
jgi:molybdenum-dependent DNA-binding transcriptional regulator ModE